MHRKKRCPVQWNEAGVGVGVVAVGFWQFAAGRLLRKIQCTQQNNKKCFSGAVLNCSANYNDATKVAKVRRTSF
jgi:hypothetical protein